MWGGTTADGFAEDDATHAGVERGVDVCVQPFFRFERWKKAACVCKGEREREEEGHIYIDRYISISELLESR